MIKEDCKNLESEPNFSCRIYRGACGCEDDCPNYEKEKKEMNISEIIKEHHQAMIDKGFYDCTICGDNGTWEEYPDPNCKICNGSGINSNKNIGELLMLIVSELGEALEAHRKNRFFNMCEGMAHNPIENLDCEEWEFYFESKVKDTFEDEIADVFLRLFDLCGYLEIEPSPNIPDSFKYNLENVGGILLYLSNNIFNIKQYSDREYYISNAIYYLWCAAVNNWGIDIEKHILAKMAYNKTRPHKHGKEY